MGTDAKGEKIKDHMKNSVPILLDSSITNPYDKLRIIALYVLIKNGIVSDNLMKLVTHANVSEDKHIIENLSLLGVNAVGDVSIAMLKITIIRF